MADYLIKNGLVATPAGEIYADVLLADGIIAVVGPGLSPPEGTRVIDAAEKLVIPGGVDAHTHLDLTVGQAHVSDGWAAGSRAAAFGGTTTIIEHPGFGPEGCSLSHQLDKYRQNAVRAVIDYGLHGVFQHWNEEAKAELPELVCAGYPSFKAYMTYDGRLSDEEFLAAAKALGQAGGLMTVHAENHAIVSHLGRELGCAAPGSAASHAAGRPDYAEALAVETAIALAGAAGDSPLYIVHLSTAKGLEAVRKAKAEGRRVWAETCPQYLFLTDSCYQGDFDESLKFVMAPPPRRKSDVEALWAGIFDGAIDAVATDHCSFSWRDKKERAAGNVFQCPGGVPGVETRLPLLYSEGVVRRGLSLGRFVRLLSSNPAELFGLKSKGFIEVGRDADVVVFDPAEEKTITAETLHQAVDYTPFENMSVRGWPKQVFSRGELIVDGERFIGEPGRGRFLARQPFSSPGLGNAP
ncbi:dihydropyrimidinase [Deltaproteobacteria bacterium OttesenSCG-928-K17]|nr:dihydropyrimidinase [Deltaproteobacteria bacterium OttesenSCG-928-K17]